MLSRLPHALWGDVPAGRAFEVRQLDGVLDVEEDETLQTAGQLLKLVDSGASRRQAVRRQVELLITRRLNSPSRGTGSSTEALVREYGMPSRWRA